MSQKVLTGSFQLMKSINRSLILNIIRQKGPISRAEIAKVTKLTPPTVSNLVKELLEAELIIERNLGESSGGRKPTLLTLNETGFYVVGVDIGSHDIKVVLTTITGNIMRSNVSSLPKRVTKDLVLNIVKKAIYSIIEDIDEEKMLGIGVAMHGIVDVTAGVSIFAPNLQLENLPLKAELEAEFGQVVRIENDGRAMSLGELWFGDGAHMESFVCINVGRGIGAGIIINGKLYHGHHYISGEIGHMTIDLNGPTCTCGNDGCLQTFASGPAIVDSVKSEIRNGAESSLSNRKLEGLTGEDIYQAALEGDALSITALKRAGTYLGIGLTNLIHTVNPERMIIGGGVANAKEFFLSSIKETVTERALTDEAMKTDIRISTFGADATVMGAVALILVELFSSEETGKVAVR